MRIRAKTLLLAILVIGLLLGGFIAMQRRASYLKDVAKYHLAAARELGDQGGAACLEPEEEEAVFRKWGGERERLYHAYKYHIALRRKYVIASRQPWLPMAPDPSPPPLAFPVLLEQNVELNRVLHLIR